MRETKETTTKLPLKYPLFTLTYSSCAQQRTPNYHPCTKTAPNESNNPHANANAQTTRKECPLKPFYHCTHRKKMIKKRVAATLTCQANTRK